MRKTMREWHESQRDFSNFATPGDIVDNEIAEHFLNAVSHVFQTSTEFQCGEPFDHDEKIRPLYSFYELIDGNWVYKGHLPSKKLYLSFELKEGNWVYKGYLPYKNWRGI